MDTLKHAEEIHLGDEHGHILKPVLALFASGAARFKDDADGKQFEQFTRLMESIMLEPNCGLKQMEPWKELLEKLEVDENAPFVNFGHDALADRNFNDLYAIPFYSKLVELSKPPSPDAEPKFQFHLSNHGLYPLTSFLANVVKPAKLLLDPEDLIKGAHFTRIDPRQTYSYNLAYSALKTEQEQIIHFVKPYLTLLKQASFMTFNADANRLTTHAPLTTESEHIMQSYMNLTPDWNDPQSVANTNSIIK